LRMLILIRVGSLLAFLVFYSIKIFFSTIHRGSKYVIMQVFLLIVDYLLSSSG
jgi:hypothetical protein